MIDFLKTNIRHRPNWVYWLGAMFLLSIVFFRFLFFQHYLLYTDIGNDSYYQTFAYIKAINQHIRETGELGWSFRFGVGQLIPPMFVGSFFNWPLFFIDDKYIPFGMVIAEIVKIGCTGFVFYQYLKSKQMHLAVALFGGWTILITGFIIINASWYTYFTYAAFLWCLWFFSLEKLKKGKLNWFALTSALVVMDQPFHFYLFCLFTIVYFLLDGSLYQYFKLISLRFIIGTLIGFCMSALFLGQNLYTIYQSPRTEKTYSMFAKLSSVPFYQIASFSELKTLFLRFFSNNIQGIGDYYTGATYYVEAPLLFVSSCSVLWLGQFFPHYNLPKYLWVALAIVIVLAFPFFRHTIWLYTGDYYRILSFAIALLIFEVSLRLLNELMIEKIQIQKKWLHLNAGIILIGFVVFSQENYTFFYVKSVIVFLTFYLVLLYANRLKKSLLVITLLSLTLLDGIVEAYSTLQLRPHLTAADLEAREGFNDYSVEAINWVNSYDTGFYRVEKDFSSGDAVAVESLNDGMIQGYNSTRQYTSFNHLSYVKYLTGFEVLDGVDEQSSRWLHCRMDRLEVLNNLCVKYIISNGTFDWRQIGYKPLKSFQNITVFSNPNYVPIGSLYNNTISESDFVQLNLTQKRKAIENYLVLPLSTLEAIKEISQEIPPIITKQNTETEMEVINHSHKSIEGSIFNKSVALMYFSIPYDTGWHIMVDGLETEILKANFGMSAILLKPGQHNVALSYQMPYYKQLVLFNVLGLILFFLLLLISKQSTFT